ncbi:MAG: PAS domain-containing protein, partial [Gammaproteobacteria bacterium]
MSEARIAERLHDEITRMQSLFDVVPTALAVIGPDRCCRYVNQAFAVAVGVAALACRGRPIDSTLPAAVCATLEPVLAAALSGRADAALYDAGGSGRSLHLRCSPWRDTDGACLAVLALEGELPAAPGGMTMLQGNLLPLVDRLPVFISYYGRDCRYHFVNARYEQWFRRPRAWFIGRPIVSVVGAEAYAVVSAQLARALAGEAVEFEFEREQPCTGQRRVLRANLVPDRRADGAVPGAFALLEDVTGQRHAERAASQARWEKEAIADRLPALVAYIDRELRYRYVNERFREWYGLPTSWFVGRRVEDVVGPEAFAITGDLLRRAAAGEELTFDYPRRNRLFAAPERTLRVQLVPDDSGDEQRGFIALMQDVTEELAAAAALRRAEQDIRAIIDSAPALVAACDMRARLVYGNRALAEWLGAPAESLAGRPALELAPRELRAVLAPEIERVLSGETVVIKEPRGARCPATGQHGYHVGTYLPLLDAGRQRGFMVMINDVTESVQAMRALREQQALLRQVTEGSSQGFVLSDLARSAIYYASPGIRRLWPREVDAHSWREAVHPDDRGALEAALAGVAASGGFAIEYRVVAADGTVRWLNDKADVVTLDDGRPARLTS